MENNELVNQWKNGLRIRHIGHTRAFSRFRSEDRVIGLLSTIFSAVVATTVFASLSKSETNTLIIIAGCVSVLATLLAASHSFLNYSELSERHRHAAASFGQLRRDLEATLIDKNVQSIDDEKLKQINLQWSELEKKSPAIPQKIYDRALKLVTTQKSKTSNE